jgi:hypothetical protein
MKSKERADSPKYFDDAIDDVEELIHGFFAFKFVRYALPVCTFEQNRLAIAECEQVLFNRLVVETQEIATVVCRTDG